MPTRVVTANNLAKILDLTFTTIYYKTLNLFWAITRKCVEVHFADLAHFVLNSSSKRGNNMHGNYLFIDSVIGKNRVKEV